MALALAARVEAERSPGGQRFSLVLAANPIHLGMALATGAAAPRVSSHHQAVVRSVRSTHNYQQKGVAAGASVQVGPSG